MDPKVQVVAMEEEVVVVVHQLDGVVHLTVEVLVVHLRVDLLNSSNSSKGGVTTTITSGVSSRDKVVSPDSQQQLQELLVSYL